MNKVGVVTVTYNSESVILEFLKSILSQTYTDFILYVIDNASNDMTLEQIKFYNNQKIIVIKNEMNKGVAAANNQGIKLALEAACDFVMLLNNDTAFEENLISKLLTVHEENNCSITTPKMMYYSEPDILWYAGGFFYRSKGYIADHRGLNEKDIGKYNSIERVDYAPTCCTSIKKAVFEDVGLMDEKYFIYSDDTDFFYRVWRDGRHIMLYVPSVKFYHKVGILTKSLQGKRNSKYQSVYLRYTTRNNIYYLKKQQSLYSKLYIAFYYIKMNLSFCISGKYYRNLETFRLLQTSFLEGLFY